MKELGFQLFSNIFCLVNYKTDFLHLNLGSFQPQVCLHGIVLLCIEGFTYIQNLRLKSLFQVWAQMVISPHRKPPLIHFVNLISKTLFHLVYNITALLIFNVYQFFLFQNHQFRQHMMSLSFYSQWLVYLDRYKETQ